MAAMMAELRRMAKDAGRDSQALEFVDGASLSLRSAPLGADRAIFTGSLDQVKSDIDAVKNSAPAKFSS
jgi:hypothetical protein